MTDTKSYTSSEVSPLKYHPDNFTPSVTITVKVNMEMFSPSNNQDPYDAIRAELEFAIQEMKNRGYGTK